MRPESGAASHIVEIDHIPFGLSKYHCSLERQSQMYFRDSSSKTQRVNFGHTVSGKLTFMSPRGHLSIHQYCSDGAPSPVEKEVTITHLRDREQTVISGCFLSPVWAVESEKAVISALEFIANDMTIRDI